MLDEEHCISTIDVSRAVMYFELMGYYTKYNKHTSRH